MCPQSASYGIAGFFGMKACADVKIDKSYKSLAIDSHSEYSIRPNINKADDDAITGLIDAFSRLAQGDATSHDNFDGLHQNAQDILSGPFLDPIQAVVIPLSSVSAVADRFTNLGDAVECILCMLITAHSLSEVIDSFFLCRTRRHSWSFWMKCIWSWRLRQNWFVQYSYFISLFSADAMSWVGKKLFFQNQSKSFVQ